MNNITIRAIAQFLIESGYVVAYCRSGQIMLSYCQLPLEQHGLHMPTLYDVLISDWDNETKVQVCRAAYSPTMNRMTGDAPVVVDLVRRDALDEVLHLIQQLHTSTSAAIAVIRNMTRYNNTPHTKAYVD